MIGRPRDSLSKFAATSEGQGVAKFLPNENAVVLKSGRQVGYDQLVIATGLEAKTDIKGFEEAWADPNHQFHTSRDHPSWKTSSNKAVRFLHNFVGGEAIFYIPPGPFHGEIENYNFFLAKDIWDRYDNTGLLSWDKSRFTVINGNDTFSKHFSDADAFIKEELQRRNINVEYGLKLVEVKKVCFAINKGKFDRHFPRSEDWGAK